MCVPADMFFRISKLVFEKEKKKINDNETTKNFVIIICVCKYGSIVMMLKTVFV